MARSIPKAMVFTGLLVLLLGLSGGCGGVGGSGKKQSKATAVLILKCDVKDAEVWINSRYSRSTAELARGLRLRPGTYRIEVRRDGFHSRYYELTLEAQERQTLDVELAQRFR